MTAQKTTLKSVAAKSKRQPAPASTAGATELTRTRKWARGIVISDKMNKTRVVRVDRQVKHGFYNKYLVKSKKYKVHDEKNESRAGDLVMMLETRPISKDKRWVLTSIVRKGEQASVITV